MIWSKYSPWSTQAEPFVWKEWMLQTSAHFFFTVLWWYFGYIGTEPLIGKPIEVEPKYAKERLLADYERVG